jgi:hypothetical protein
MDNYATISNKKYQNNKKSCLVEEAKTIGDSS